MAGAMRGKESNGGTYTLYYYKCEICAGFHLTRVVGGNSILAE